MTPNEILLGIDATAIAAHCLHLYVHAAQHGSARVAWRHATGARLDGIEHTNATMWRSGDRILHPSGRATRHAHRSKAHRALIRHGYALALLGTGAGLIADPMMTDAGLIGAATVGTAYTAWRTVRKVRNYRHQRHLVNPLAGSLARVIGITDDAALKAVKIPAHYASVTEGCIGTIALPDNHPVGADIRKALTHLVTTHLPVDVDVEFRTASYPKAIVLKACPKPPDRVSFAEMREAMLACKPGEVVLGLDKRKNVFKGSFLSDDPHWGFSVGSGRGKSTMLVCTGVQILRQDPESTITCIDPKRASFTSLVGIPGVEIYNDPRRMEAMWAGIERFEKRMQERLEALEHDPTLEFPAMILFMDEINQFGAMTAAVWKEVREKGQPATPPVWMKLASILWMGRAANAHAILVGQRLDSASTGNVGLRDSLGFRGVAGFRANQYRMLISESGPVPKSQKPKGRWLYSDGEDETWCQNMYGTPEEVRDWALANRRLPINPDPTPELVTASAVTGTEWVIGHEALADPLGVSLSAVRKRLARNGRPDGEVKQGGIPMWSAESIEAWSSARGKN